MKISLEDKNLTERERREVVNLLQKANASMVDDLEQMWYLMDLVWDEYGCDNKKNNFEKISRYYSHPVWLLNGLFIEQDDVSMGHRHAISDWIVDHDIKNVLDYGGGFGTLARLVAQKDGKSSVNIYEPHPSEFGLKRAEEFGNITIVDKLDFEYDCLVSTDVLEHVSDPLEDFAGMIKAVKKDGYLIIANCFFPVIKCHLPQNFHFRYTFNLFAMMMGLKVIGKLAGSHATIFQKVKVKDQNWVQIRFFEKLSKFSFPILKFMETTLKSIKRSIIK
ncbi:MAG: methyltransferase domain-containing protein [Parcubacteria group bacterium]|jgi:2-polyprenyl-6-hydroxyphenyl methylase/3-demethylubiquinone-9 3-methyltransferase